MELKNEFRVRVSAETTWQAFNDVELIAPCLPGAQLQEIEGGEYRGIVKVKVGPITAQYKGKATFVEQDQAAGRVVLKASGRDTGGGGNANATITATMVADGDGTRVTVVTDLAVTGKLAQFGRGVLAEVSTNLLGQFVECLEHRVLAESQVSEPQPEVFEPEAEPEPQGTGPEPDAAESQTEAAEKEAPETQPRATEAEPESEPGPESPGPAVSGVRRVEGPEVAPVDLLQAAGSSVAKRLLPPLAGFAALVLVILIWRRRHLR
jgi:carbon monoxide dehydrogenase subunit G